MKNKMSSEISRLNQLPLAPTEISFDDFLEEFMPDPNCKKGVCCGRGFTTQIFQNIFLTTGRPAPILGGLDKEKKKIVFCPCVWKQYLKSDKHYRIYVTMDDGKKEFLLL